MPEWDLHPAASRCPCGLVTEEKGKGDIETKGSVLGAGLSPRSPTDRAAIWHTCAFRAAPWLIAGMALCPTTICLGRAAAANSWQSQPGICSLRNRGNLVCYSALFFLCCCLYRRCSAQGPVALRISGPDLEIGSCHFTTECVENSHSLIP